MTFSIMTWMDDSGPRLGVLDTETGRLRQLWRLYKLQAPEDDGLEDLHPPGGVPEESRVTDLHQLIRRLFLMGCCSDMKRFARLGDEPWQQEEMAGNGRWTRAWFMSPAVRTSPPHRTIPALVSQGSNALCGFPQLRKQGGGVSS